jgi:hypothetical protein
VWISLELIKRHRTHGGKATGNESYIADNLQPYVEYALNGISYILVLSRLIFLKIRKKKYIYIYITMAHSLKMGQRPPHYQGFAITLTHTILGRTSLEEWSARRRDLYLPTQHSQETDLPPGGFEPTIPTCERPQTHALTFRNRASYIYDGHTATLLTPHFMYFFKKKKYVLNFLNMPRTLRFFFSLQNAVYFIMLPFLFLYYSHFTYRVC